MGINAVKKFFADKKQTKTQKDQLNKMKEYYTKLRCGAEFVKAIQADLANQQNKMNRHARRRFEKSLVKGEFTPELVDFYKNNLDKILVSVDKKLESLETKPVEVDAAKLYEDAKKKESK